MAAKGTCRWRGTLSLVMTLVLVAGLVPAQALAEAMDGEDAIGVEEVEPREESYDADADVGEEIDQVEVDAQEIESVGEDTGPIAEEDDAVESASEGIEEKLDSVDRNEEDSSAVEKEGVEGEREDLALATQSAIVSNPRIMADSSMKAGQVTTWDCVWLGSYPQTEVTASDPAYASLTNATFDSKGDATVGGKRYRRISRDDATYSGYWSSGSATYRYFRHEPIKWRVLEVNGSSALVVADVALDGQRFNANYVDVTWETSSVRSWLNGYGAGFNQPRTDFASRNFFDTAFASSQERLAVNQTTVANADNQYYGTDGGSDTSDRVFLLAESDVLGPSATRHGFFSDGDTYDEARRCKPSDYANAMGAYNNSVGYSGNCTWFLRTPGGKGTSGTCVHGSGVVDLYGDNVDGDAIRPALNLNLTSSAVSSAGTISSNDAVNEQPAPDPSYVIVNSAKCGPNLYWSYKDGKLTISGSGKMTSHPWNNDYDLEGQITSLSLPSGLTSICDDAFRDCAALTKSTTLPESLTSIGNGAFYGCTSLQAVPLPDGITTIEDYTFAHCSSLNMVSIPATVTSIGDTAFGDCNALRSGDVYYQGSENSWNALPKGMSNEALTYARKHFSDRLVTGRTYDGRLAYAPTPEERVQQLAVDYESKADGYVEKLKKAAEDEKKACQNAGSQDHAQVLRDINGTSLSTSLAIDPNMPSACKDATYKALAAYFDECREEAIGLELGDKLSDSAIDKIRHAMGNFDSCTKRVDGHKVLIEALPSFTIGDKSAYTLQVTVDGKYQCVVCSSTNDTKDVLNAYMKQLKKLADNAKGDAVIAVASDMAEVAGISSWCSKSNLKKFLDKKVAKLDDGLLKSACNGLLKIYEGYEVTKMITSAKDLSSAGGVLSNPKGLCDKLEAVDLNELTAFGAASHPAFDAAGKAVKNSKEALAKALLKLAEGQMVEKSWREKANDAFAQAAPQTWDNASKTVTVQCPVDVYVCDAAGGELGRIVDGEVVCGDSIAMRLDGDVKTVAIPSYVDASIQLVGTDAGSMTCVVEQMVGGTVTGRANWYDVPLTEGGSYTQEISAEAMTGSSVDPLVSGSGEVAASEYISIDDAGTSVSVAVAAGEGGVAVGSDTYARGDSATVRAYPDDRYSFDGWYEGDTLVSMDLAYRFPALRDVSLEARFWIEEAKDEDYVSVVSKLYSDKLGLVVWYDEPVNDNIMVGTSGYEEELPETLTILKLDDAGGVIEEASYVPESRHGAWLIVRGVDLTDAACTEVLMPDGTRIGTIYPADAEIPAEGEDECEPVDVSDPRVVADSSMEAGQVTTWDCVWLGSYPQTEVTASDPVYASLQSATYDSKGDATVGGNRYRRISRADASYSGYWSDDGYGSATYRYFRWEPVKWRVLEANGSSALVVADVALDDQRYNANAVDVTWETSSVRSWLNGYGAGSNQPGTDCSSKSFYDAAFSSAQKSAILQTAVANADNQEYGTDGRSDTSDRVFLLAESEVYGAGGARHGFANGYSTYDEARRCKATDYARAMGAWRSNSSGYEGNCWWWLRSPVDDQHDAAYVARDGGVGRDGDYVYDVNGAVRPALNLNLTSSAVSRAGTVSSDGVVDERAKSISIASAAVSAIADQTYTGSAVRPTPSVKVGGQTLKKDADYTLKYASNTNVGTATITITGIGNFTDSKNVTFSIVKAASTIKLAAQTKTYTGNALAYSGKVTRTGSAGKVTYKYYSDAKCTKAVAAANVKNAGTYYVKGTVAADANYKSATSAAAKLTVAKAASTIKLAAQTKTYAGKALSYSGKVTRTGSAGKVTYKYYSDAKCTKAVAASNVKNAKVYYVRATVAADANYKAATSAAAKLTVAKAASTIKLAAQTKTYAGKALSYSGKVTRTGSAGKVTYKYYSDAKCTKAVAASNVKNAKVYYVRATVAADANYKAATSAAAKFTVAKAANPMVVKATAKTVSYSKVRSAAQTVAPLTVTKAQGTKAFSVAKWTTAKAKSYMTVNKTTGKVTVKKGTPKGTYKFQIKVTAKGGANYKAGTKTMTVTIVVK